jgi:hypothetical protein
MTAEGGTARKTGARGSELLQRLKRGEISVEEYLEAKVETAIARLGPLVTDAQRGTVREALREHVLADPGVAERVRRLVSAKR